jgi:hypothetical protein
MVSTAQVVRIPTELRSSWNLLSAEPETIIIQLQPQPSLAGEVRIANASTSVTAYSANFSGWNPSWSLDLLLIAMFGSGVTAVTETFFVLYYAEAPSAHFTVPGTNGATVADTVRPTVQWSYAAGDLGGPQSAYRILLYTQAQTQAAGFVPAVTAAVWDSLTVNSSVASVTVPVNLGNNTTYVAYLAVAQTVGGTTHWASGYATRTFTISIPAASVPARPTVTATADSTNARIGLSVFQSTTPAWDHVVVERSNDDGATWVGVRNGDVDIAVGDTLALYDYESGNGETVVYRAQAQRTSTTGGLTQVTVSPWSLSSTPTSWSSTSVWLKSPVFPGFNTTIRLGAFGTFTRSISRGVFPIVGRSRPVVVSDVRQGLEGQMTVAVRSVAELNAIRFMSDVSATVLLQTPPSYNFGSKYLALGDEHEDRINIVASNPYRWVQFDFTEVDSPVADAVLTEAPPVIITPPTVTGYLLDEAGNVLTDEAGNRLTAP